jgi:bacillithiol synthase
MLLRKIPLADTRAFSTFFSDYIEQKNSLKQYYNRFPQIENFKEQIRDKGQSFSSQHRQILCASLKKQYKDLTVSEPVKKNLTALASERTFTVTTGHQLNIFTGPLYFIYKIVTAINSCKALKAQYPGYDFVPVYWMASEDHDFEEIKYFKLYGKKYVWETTQRGAVGRFSTEGLDQVLNQLPGDVQIFRDAYQKHKTLSDAVRDYVNQLFGEEGVVVLDPDDHDLKGLFRDVIREDVVKCSTRALVEKTNQGLESLSYETQVHCRDINFFYVDDQLRSRIEKKDDRYHILDTSLTFSEAEIKDLIEKQPGKFSPNVILRPLYQEFVLPNLAYVGGPTVFDRFQIPFPIIMPRNFGLIIEHPVFRKFEKTGLELSQLFEEKNFLFNHWVLKHSKHNLTVGPERTTVNDIFTNLQQRAEAIDKTLSPYVGAEGKRALNSLEKIERKLLRAEKRQQSDKLRQIEAVKDALFPNGSLQERTDNFLNFYQQDQTFISKLVRYFDPFDFKFNVLIYPSA